MSIVEQAWSGTRSEESAERDETRVCSFARRECCSGDSVREEMATWRVSVMSSSMRSVHLTIQRCSLEEGEADRSSLSAAQVHERSVDGDFLLLELRELLKRNKKIKVVLMSATINHLTFTTYFGGAPLLEIVGRTFPVEDHVSRTFLPPFFRAMFADLPSTLQYLEDVIKQISYRPSAQRGGGGGGKLVQRQTQEQIDAFRTEYESRGLDANSIQILDTVSRSDKLDAALVAAVAAHAIADSGGEKGGVLIFCPGQSNIARRFFSFGN